MATLTNPPAHSRNLDESRRRVQHPLQRLRRWIRSYVTAEGLALLLLYLALWFWIGLALDWGAFALSRTEVFYRIFHEPPIDWVLILPPWFRGSILLILVAGLLALVALKVFVRLFYDFRESALALVLERRFPKLLGDRLITAVELADRRKAARYGYSQEMIDETVAEAADRVDRAPLGEVFNWGRLAWQAALLVVFVLVAYVVVGAGACAVDYASEGQARLAGFGNFHDVSAMWAERNLLLQNTPWPRRAFVEVVGFPESGELRIGQEAPPPTIRARAVKWVIADRDVPEGWRALRWSDLAKPELLGAEAPPLPAAVAGLGPLATVDQVEIQLAKLDVDRLIAVKDVVDHWLDPFTKLPEVTIRKNTGRAEAHGTETWVIQDGKGGWRALLWHDLQRLAPQVEGSPTIPDLPAGWPNTVDQVAEKLDEVQADQLVAVKTGAIARLNEIIDAGRLKREVRRLDVPEALYVLSRGTTTRNQMKLERQGDNEYSGTFAELKESVKFQVRGEDYYTPERTITLVPPPRLESMVRDEYRPAYLFYRLPQGVKADDFKGLKQLFRNLPISVTGGDTSRIEVPAGTDVVLTGRTDKPLRAGGARILPPRKGVVEVKADVRQLDDQTFQTEFKDVRSTLDFVFEFTDTDNVVSLRHVIIKPLEDVPPDADVQVEVVRKTNQGFLVTPKATIPFSGKVRDDHALESAEYALTLQRMDSTAETGSRALLVISALYQLVGGPGQDLRAAATAATLAKDTKADSPGEPEVQRLPILSFATRLRDRLTEETVPMDRLHELLSWSPGETRPDPNDPTGKAMLRHPLGNRTLFREHTLDADEDPDKAQSAFDLRRLPQTLAVPENQIQPRYRMQLWVEALDNDLLTGPHRSRSKENFTFLIVSENELLSEVAKEEELLHVKLDDMVNRLKENRSKLDTVISELGGLGGPALKPEQLAAASVRGEEVEQALEKGLDTTREVHRDYSRILKELRTNRVNPGMITKVERQIIEPLDEIMRQGGPFTTAGDAVHDLRKVLDNTQLDPGAKSDQARVGSGKAREELTALIQKLTQVLTYMEGIATVNKLIDQLRKLEEEERAQVDLIERLKKKVDEDLFKDLFGPDTKPKEKKP